MTSTLSLASTPLLASREVLAETAVAAAGGGEVVALHPDTASGSTWTATVATPAGLTDVRLDTRLRTAVLAPRTLVTAHAIAA